jgi:hypothetical protein
MDAEAITLFNELADRSLSEREEYYARHQVSQALRAEVESLLHFDAHDADSLHQYVGAAAASAASAPALLPGARLGPYEVIAPVGAGGMGTFYTDGKLKAANVADGSIHVICDMPDMNFGRGGAWAPNGVIVFQTGYDGPLQRVSAAGSTPVPATALDRSRGEVYHAWPSFLPDGRHFLYAAATGGKGGVFGASLDSNEVKPLFDVPSNAIYASGYLLFGVNGVLMAQPFDAAKLQLEGEPVRIADHVLFNPASWRSAFAPSANGVLAYRLGAPYTFSQS